MKTSIMLLLAGVMICSIDFAKAQSINDTNTFEPTCPPPRICPPQPICTCPTIAECSTETTRTRGRSPGRTRGTETRTETNRTRTDTKTGRDRTATNGTRTDTRTTRRTGTKTPKTRSPGTRTRKRCVPKVPPGCPTAPSITTTTMAETTTIEPTGFNITTIEPTTTEEFDLNDTTTEMDGNTTEPFNITEVTTTEATTTEATTTEVITTEINTTEPTDFNVTDTTTATDAATTTDANATDANATEATTTEATTTEATTTEATTTEAATPPAPLTTQPPGPNITATCSSPLVDMSGQKQPPIRIFRFLVDKHNLSEYTNEAKDLLEFIAWLTKLSNIHGTMKSTLLGVSSHQSGLSVTIAVSFKVYPGTNYTTSSTQIIEAVYNNFDVLREYYDVIDIKLVSLSTESSSPQAHQGRSGHKIVATKPIVVLSVIAMVGLAGAVAALSAKIIKHYGNKPSGEKRPLLEDRADGQRGFTLNG